MVYDNKSPARRAFLFLLLLPLLDGCRSLQDAHEVEANILAPGNFRKGSGVIESLAPVAGQRNVWRLYLRMVDTAGFQSIDVDYGGYLSGEVVELTNDGRVVRATGTSLKHVIRR
jgi:hypothetical protein